MKLCIVEVTWDAEAKVWCAEGVNFGGLATWATTLDELRAKIEIMIPELLDEEDEGHHSFRMLVESCVVAGHA